MSTMRRWPTGWTSSMRISDIERREVAARLREKKREFFAEGCFYPQDLTLYQSLYLKAIEECLPDGDCGFDILADLIDRPMTRNLSEKPEFVCELCGAVWPYDLGFTHCPECGAEVVSDGC